MQRACSVTVAWRTVVSGTGLEYKADSAFWVQALNNKQTPCCVAVAGSVMTSRLTFVGGTLHCSMRRRNQQQAVKG